MTAEGEFSVYQFFENDMYEEIIRFTDDRTSVETAAKLVQSIGAKLGTTKRVIITDGGDCTVFEWIHGLGIVWPPQEGEVEQ